MSAALLLPPWGRAGAAVGAFIAGAAGGAGLFGYAIIRYPGGNDGGIWVFLAFFLAVLAGDFLAAVSWRADPVWPVQAWRAALSSRRAGWRSPGSRITRRPRRSPRRCGWSWCRWRWGGRRLARRYRCLRPRTALLAGLSAALALFLIRVGVLVATGGGPYTLVQIREAGGTT